MEDELTDYGQTKTPKLVAVVTVGSDTAGKLSVFNLETTDVPVTDHPPTLKPATS